MVPTTRIAGGGRGTNVPNIHDFVSRQFAAPDYGNVLAQAQGLNNARQSYEMNQFDLEGARAERNALAGGDVNALARVNPQMAGQYQSVQSTQRKQALETLARTMDAVGKSKRPLALGAQVVAMPDFQSALQSLGIDPSNFTIDENDTDDTLRQQAMELAGVFGGIGQNGARIGVANPSDFEPESLRAYQNSGDPGVLVPRTNMFGKYTPSNYTTESWAQFEQTRDPSALVLRPNNAIQTTAGGGLLSVDRNDPSNTQTVVPDAQATNAAAELARRKAAAEAAGKAEGSILSKATNAEGINQILDLADPLIDVATGSTAGAARDAVAAFFGYAPDSAQAIGQLQVLQAAMMMSMPRMEGPQSDKDVQLYQKAAADLGNANTPNATKKAAVATIRALQQKYIQRAGGDEQYSEGEVLVNPDTGERIKLVNGEWVSQ
jgi:hypothetical protein